MAEKMGIFRRKLTMRYVLLRSTVVTTCILSSFQSVTGDGETTVARRGCLKSRASSPNMSPALSCDTQSSTSQPIVCARCVSFFVTCTSRPRKSGESFAFVLALRPLTNT